MRKIIINNNVLDNYLKKWGKLENYMLQENSLHLLFNEYCPNNKKIEHVLLKVSALNDFYSTNIFDTYSVAKHILKYDVDKYLKQKDYSIVNKIAKVTIKGKTKNFYSFATKYCNHHDQNNYPIYDSYVEKMLIHFKKCDNFYKFNKADLKDYILFIEIIEAFKSFYKLNAYSLREIDIFLWLAGKKHFPKKYY